MPFKIRKENLRRSSIQDHHHRTKFFLPRFFLLDGPFRTCSLVRPLSIDCKFSLKRDTAAETVTENEDEHHPKLTWAGSEEIENENRLPSSPPPFPLSLSLFLFFSYEISTAT